MASFIKHIVLAIGVVIGILMIPESAYAQSKTQPSYYTPTWESVLNHQAAPEWFEDAKFGIYFHWGPYSVPAFGSAWYPRNMYLKNHRVSKFHKENYGPIEEFGYENFIPLFKAQYFDPKQWADLFAASGAKFAGPVAQHHDGFAMWDSDVNPWNVKDMGPKRDILGELFVELRKRDLKTIATFHHARNGQRNANNPKLWGRKGYNSHYPYDPNLPTSTTDPKLRKLFGNFEHIDDFNAYWLNQINEVVDKYSPDIIWFDSWLNLIPEAYRLKMVAHHLNNGLKQNKEVVLCHKQNDLPQEISIYDFEQGGRRDVYPIPWMTDITLGESRWMFVKDHPNKNAALVIRNMIDVWSKNGTVLLNVSPKADGTIPLEQQHILRQIGTWLDIHGEAVFKTRPHLVFGYGTAIAAQGSHDGQSSKVAYTANDVRFTISKDQKAMYVFFLGKPEAGKRIQLRTIGGYHRNIPPGKISNVHLLGSKTAVKWEHTAESFFITMPQTPMNDVATVFKLELEKF